MFVHVFCKLRVHTRRDDFHPIQTAVENVNNNKLRHKIVRLYALCVVLIYVHHYRLHRGGSFN